MRKMKSSTKGASVTGGAAAIVTYAAGLASQKWNVPLEVAAVIVGGVFSFVGRWAARLIPDPK